MRRLRALFGFLLASGTAAGVWLVSHGSAPRARHVPMVDARCLGCVPPVFRALPGGSDSVHVATGWLQGTWGQSITTTRASTKYCGTTTGGLGAMATGTPCVDTVGLNIEGTSTNLALQSSAPATAPWTANAVGVAGPAITNNAVVAPDGSTSAATMAFPAVGTNQASDIYQGFTATAAPYTASVYLKVASGTATVYLYFGNAAYTVTACSVTTSWTRCAVTATLTAATWYIQFGADNRIVGESTQPAQTIHAWGFQVEQQSFATSYIATTTTTASRSADVINTASTFNIGTKPSFSADVTLAYVIPAGQNQTILQASNSASDRWTLDVSNGQVGCDYYNGTTDYAYRLTSPTVTAGTKAHTLCSYDGANLKVCVNGTCGTSAQAFTAASTSYPLNYWNYFNQTGEQLFGEEANTCMAATPTGCT